MERAAGLGLAAIALTDHDTVDGVQEAREEAAARGLEFLSGVEISADLDGREIHLLAYGIDIGSAALSALLGGIVRGRLSRAEKIIEKLVKGGVPIEGEALLARLGTGCVTRMHIAHELVERGVVREPQAAFDKYLNRGGKAFVPKETVSCAEALAAVHGAGGLAFIAHPGLGGTLRSLMPKLLLLPFDGIEVYHSGHSAGHVDAFRTLAEENGLLVSGGSDCHGEAKGEPLMGRVHVPYAVYARIRAALDQKRIS